MRGLGFGIQGVGWRFTCRENRKGGTKGSKRDRGNWKSGTKGSKRDVHPSPREYLDGEAPCEAARPMRVSDGEVARDVVAVTACVLLQRAHEPQRLHIPN